ncbi:MAG: rRNA maturation RNase YbeY, partial [Candidatus Aminicenantes bacterium]|nr:rRNA maturation RNase YbeY [Candidatus Aminicenantes bacterium]
MIEIINKQKCCWINKDNFISLIKKMIEHFDLHDPEVILTFVDDQEMMRLNKQYRDMDASTDVLSFSLNEKGPDGKFYLGDIVISVPKAYEQSKEKKHTLEKELKVLTIHGFLHLLGYEHF